MTELMTAEEWQKKILELLTDWENDNEGSSLDAEVDILRDIQRNAAQHWLEAAAKAVCLECGEGVRFMYLSGGLSRHIWGSESHPCYAATIWDLLPPKDPAPAGPETGSDDENA